MQVQENFSLKKYNTFGIDAKAKYFAELDSLSALQIFFENEKYRKDPKLILGGGSNILFIKDFDGIVLRNKISGIDVIREDEKYVYVKVGSGENWHQFVLHCINKNLAGVENLSLIPGNVGASPMQNIGAYGVELRDVFHELEAWDLQDGKIRM